MTESTMLFPLVDGGILDIKTDAHHYNGCPTCDYGSEYITDCIIRLTQGKIHIHENRMYSHNFSEGSLLEMICFNHKAIGEMTEAQFTDYVKSWLDEHHYNIEMTIIEED